MNTGFIDQDKIRFFMFWCTDISRDYMRHISKHIVKNNKLEINTNSNCGVKIFSRKLALMLSTWNKIITSWIGIYERNARRRSYRKWKVKPSRIQKLLNTNINYIYQKNYDYNMYCLLYAELSKLYRCYICF